MRAMKDSGIEWIGDVPLNWELSKIGAVYEERNTRVSDTDYMALSVTKQGIVPQLDTAAKTDNGNNRKLIKKNDFVINSRSDRRGSCGISEYDGSCSLINIVLRPRRNMVNEYYSFVFRSELFADEFFRYGNGIVDDLWSTKWANMKRICIPMPTVEEQYQIAHFLDDKCFQIDAIIARQEEVIEKLKRYKTSLITEAVTRGLNSDEPMSISNRSVLGETPRNWSVTKIKYVCKLNPSERSSPSNFAEVSYLPMECVKNGYMLPRTMQKEKITPGLTFIVDGDIVLAKVTPCFENGNIAIAEDLCNGVAYGSSELFVLRCLGIDTKFLFYLLQNSVFKDYGASTMTGTGGLKRVSADFVRNFTFAYPSREEQQRISVYLDSKCVSINNAIIKKKTIIDNLIMYKKSLIHEAVTGKKPIPSVKTMTAVQLTVVQTPTQNDDHEHSVLMGEVLDQLGKDAKGRTKILKCMYAITCITGILAGTQYVRQKYGPYNDRIEEYESIVARNKWFFVRRGSKTQYAIGVRFSECHAEYVSLFSANDLEIKRIISFFKPMSTAKAGRVGTLMGVWNDFILDGVLYPTDAQLIEEVRTKWTENKARITVDKWQVTLDEMKAENIVPRGLGLHTITIEEWEQSHAGF